jgi:hypothetical protein
MFSEYGAGGYHACDQGSDFIKTLALSPFSGVAGAAMNWDWQFPGQEQYWHYMGPVNERMSGIKLDEENWVVGEPIVSANKAVEVLYLRNFVEDNYRAAGVVSNRTYNHHTQSTGGLCDDISSELANPDNAAYLNTESYISTVESQILILPDLGVELEYSINWYNALTGVFLETSQEITDETGNLELHFPLLTGHNQQPMVLFEVYRSNQSGFKSLSQGSASTQNQINYEIDKDLESLETAKYGDDNNLKVNIIPNPTISYLTVESSIDLVIGAEWQLLNGINEVLMSGIVDSRNFSMDLSDYATGVYFLLIYCNGQRYVYPIIKK